jgi:hypothetical protein
MVCYVARHVKDSYHWFLGFIVKIVHSFSMSLVMLKAILIGF